jgi:rhodanese-related sulfurtransferase
MCGRPSTTIGFERLFNPLARLERGPFVALLEDGIPARPLNMTAIEATNRGAADREWAMLTSLPSVPEIGIEELDPHAPGAMVLDVREPAEYARGHIPGAVNIPQSDIATRLDDIPRLKPVMVVCQGGFRSLRATQFLWQSGYRQVTNVRGGAAAWIEAGKPVSTDDSISSDHRIIESEWTHAGAATYSI